MPNLFFDICKDIDYKLVTLSTLRILGAQHTKVNLQETLTSICMLKKISFISISGTLVMLHHPHQKSWCQLVRIFLGYLYAKTDYHLFLKIFQRNSKLVILDSVDIPGYTHLKLEETFGVYLKAKINFIFQVFEILQPYCRLFSLGNLGMPGYKHRK